MSPIDEWQKLRDIIAEEPSEFGFRLVCTLLDTWQGSDSQTALEYAREKLDTWPDDTRIAPWTWCSALANGESSLSWQLMRSISTIRLHLGCKNVPLNTIVSELDTSRIRELYLGGYYAEDATELKALIEYPDRWANLQSLSVPAYFQNREYVPLLLKSPIIDQLRSLKFYIHPKWTETSVLARSFPKLESLIIQSGMHDLLIDILASLDTTKLTSLSLQGSFHDSFDLAAVKRLAKLPLLEQIHTLELGTEWTDKSLRALVKEGKFNLNSLTIRGSYIADYFHNVNENRIGIIGFRALIQSGILKDLESLSIQYQRVGDELVDLVRATTPGKLRKLELLDIELTEEGAEALAGLPQLSGLQELNLLANPLTPRGIQALANSPYLTNLKSLTLGGNKYNSYYGYCHPRPIQDEGVFALLESSILDHLESLSLIHGKIGSAGIRALLTCEKLKRLKYLDLSYNPFGLESMEILDSTNLPNLETLQLDCCRLEDRSIEALVRGNLPALRILKLAYNSIGPDGAKALAHWSGISQLRSLNLHDNILDSKGLIALAQAPYRGLLLELDVEQDCWNCRAEYFNDEAAQAVAESTFFSRLDSFWGGMVDEYHGSRYRHPFLAEGMKRIQESKLKPSVRWGLWMCEDDPSVDNPLEDEELNELTEEDEEWVEETEEDEEAGRRDCDFRFHPPKEYTDPPTEGYQVRAQDITKADEADTDETDDDDW